MSEDPAKAWDSLVSQCLTVNSPTTKRKPFGLMPLRLRKVPAREVLPGHERTIAAIAEPIRASIRKVIAGELPWPIVMYGKAGLGKTSAALCLIDVTEPVIDGYVDERPVYGAGPIYETAGELADKYRGAEMGTLQSGGDRGRLETRGMSVRRFNEGIESTPLLVVDELGCRDKVSDFHYETVKRAIDRRSGKPLVVISNLGPKDLAAVYDDRIVDRLWAGTVIEFSGKSRRIG